MSHLNFLKFCVKVNDTLTTNTKAKKTTKLTLTRTPHVDSSIIYLFIYYYSIFSYINTGYKLVYCNWSQPILSQISLGIQKFH